MNHYRIRKDGMEFPVAGLEALVRLVQEGTLGPDERVFDPESDQWRRASELGALRPIFAARSEGASSRRDSHRGKGGRARPGRAGNPDELRRQAPVVFHRPTDLTDPDDPSDEIPRAQSAPTTVIQGGNLRDRSDDAEEDTPEEDTADTDDGARGPPASAADRASAAEDPHSQPQADAPGDDEPSGAQVIAFPTRERNDDGRARASQLAPDISPEELQAALVDPTPFLRADSKPPRSTTRLGSQVRPLLLLGTAAIGIAFALLVVKHIESTSKTVLDPMSRLPEAEQPEPVQAPVPTAEVEADDGVFYEEMERELRNRMMSGTVTITRDDDLETALMIELSRLDIHARHVHAPILRWGGRRGDVPLDVEIKIWYPGVEGELDQELASVGLVVGKYAQHYSLDVRAFEVFIEGDDGAQRKHNIDIDAARQFYLRRSTLVKFLAGDEAP